MGVPFLKGPIPMAWLNAAAKLPGKTLNVGIAIWWLAGMSKTTAFKPMLALLDEARKASVSARVAPMYAMGFHNKREDPEEGLPTLLK